MQQRFWLGAQADEKEVALEGGLAGTLAADYQLDDPAAARPGRGEKSRACLALSVQVASLPRPCSYKIAVKGVLRE